MRCLVTQYRVFSSSRGWHPVPTFGETECKSCHVPLVEPEFDEGMYVKCDNCNNVYCNFNSFNSTCLCGKDHNCSEKMFPEKTRICYECVKVIENEENEENKMK